MLNFALDASLSNFLDSSMATLKMACWKLNQIPMKRYFS
jgi:hypothetical protein